VYYEELADHDVRGLGLITDQEREADEVLIPCYILIVRSQWTTWVF